jgi:hypothetical protein
MGKKSRSVSGINPGPYFRELRKNFGLKYLNSLMGIRIRDLVDPGFGIRDGKKSDPG